MLTALALLGRSVDFSTPKPTTVTYTYVQSHTFTHCIVAAANPARGALASVFVYTVGA